MKQKFLLSLAATLALAVNAVAAPASPATVDNLNAALRGESNACHRYTVFARVAAGEGHAQAAKLFRAAAAAEAIHRDNHQAALVKLGARVDSIALDAVVAKTTADNLRAAIAGESHERDAMYPGFIQLAKSENNREALRTFQFAVAAETEHAALYTAALAQLGQKNAAAVDFYVCPVCGETVAGRPTKEKCPTCRKPTAKFTQIV